MVSQASGPGNRGWLPGDPGTYIRGRGGVSSRRRSVGLMSRAAISRFQVEWFNVTYRSVFGVIGLLVVLVGGGGAYWYGTRVHGPRKAAREAIARAEGRLAD